MQAIFDHINSIIISSVVLLIFIFLQFRNTMNASEQTINYMVLSEVYLMNQMLEKDLENMLTAAQTNQAIAANQYRGASGAFTCELTVSDNQVSELTFPSLNLHVDSSMSALNPMELEAHEIEYRLTATGDSTNIPVQNVTQRVPLYRLDRVINDTLTANSLPYITSFSVQFIDRTTNTPTPANNSVNGTTACALDLSRVRFEFSLASEGVEFITQDQRSTSRHNMSRFGSTVSLSNWN